MICWGRKRKGIVGDKWTYQLSIAEYQNANGKYTKNNYSDLETVLAAPELSDLLDQRIVNLEAFRIKLPGTVGNTMLDELLTHHFMVAKTDTGICISFEKNPTCIMIQISRLPELPASQFREWRDGKKRKNLDSLISIKSDSELDGRMRTIRDIVTWIIENKLPEPYHLANGNCQYFVINIWHKCSNKDFPNPGEVKRPDPPPPLPFDRRCFILFFTLYSLVAFLISVLVSWQIDGLKVPMLSIVPGPFLIAFFAWITQRQITKQRQKRLRSDKFPSRRCTIILSILNLAILIASTCSMAYVFMGNSGEYYHQSSSSYERRKGLP